MIHVLMGKSSSGKTWYVQHKLLKQTDDPVIYVGLPSAANSWKDHKVFNVSQVPKEFEEILGYDTLVFEMNDRIFSFLPYIDRIIELSEKSNIYVCLEYYNTKLLPIFEHASAITYFALAPGPLLDVPKQFQPDSDKYHEILDFNEDFSRHQHYTLPLSEQGGKA